MSKTSRRSFLSILGIAAASPVLAKMAMDPQSAPKLGRVSRVRMSIEEIRDTNVLAITEMEGGNTILPGHIVYVDKVRKVALLDINRRHLN